MFKACIKYAIDESTNASDLARSRGQDDSEELIDHTASPEHQFTEATLWLPLLIMPICTSPDAGELILAPEAQRFSNRTAITCLAHFSQSPTVHVPRIILGKGYGCLFAQVGGLSTWYSGVDREHGSLPDHD